jgi:hypothetical protein
LGQQVGAVAALDLSHRGDDVQTQGAAVLPRECRGMVGGDMLGDAVEQVGDPLVRRTLRHVRPVRGEDVVGAASEHQFERTLERAAHHFFAFGGVGPDPAAVGEAAAGVFLRAAGRLHHAVEADHCGYGELSHVGVPMRIDVSHLSYRRVADRRIDKRHEETGVWFTCRGRAV